MGEVKKIPTEQILVFVSNSLSPAEWQWFEADELDKAIEYAEKELSGDSINTWAGIYHTTQIDEMRREK